MDFVAASDDSLRTEERRLARATEFGGVWRCHSGCARAAFLRYDRARQLALRENNNSVSEKVYQNCAKCVNLAQPLHGAKFIMKSNIV